MSEAWQLRCKAEGRCVSCGQPARPGKVRCQPCATRDSAGSLRWYYRRRAAGLCLTCQQPATGVRCDACREAHNALYRSTPKVGRKTA